MKKALLILLAFTLLLCSAGVVTANQDDQYRYGFSDQYGVYETGEDGNPIYIWFWSEWARQLIMGDLTAPGTDVHERPADAPDGEFFLGYASVNAESIRSEKPTKEPTTVTPEPTTVTPEPTTETPEPTTETPEPTTETPEPTTETPEPTTETPEPTTETPEPTTETPEPTTETPEPTTETPEPTTETPEPTVYPTKSDINVTINFKCSKSSTNKDKSYYSKTSLNQIENDAKSFVSESCKIPTGQSCEIMVQSVICGAVDTKLEGCTVRPGNKFSSASMFNNCVCVKCPSGYSYNVNKGVCLLDSN